MKEYYVWIHSPFFDGYDYFRANGPGGQFIVVVSDIKLMATVTNMWNGIPTATANHQWYNTLDIIMNKIIQIY